MRAEPATLGCLSPGLSTHSAAPNPAPADRSPLYRLGVSSSKRIGNWTPDGKVERAIARREYLELTPGQRVEQAMALSEEMTKLAIRGRQRARAERG